MNSKILIDALVQQTTVLIAQLSTAAGVRSPLATIADQVFVELAREIENQGVSRKVAADMFGMALRTYQCKVQRLEESITNQGKTLWEEVLDFVSQNPGVDRREIEKNFDRDSGQSIGAVLKDLGNNGLLYRAGVSSRSRYRAVPEDERQALHRTNDEDALDALVQVAIYRGATDATQLARRLGAATQSIEETVDRLIKTGVASRNDQGELSVEGVLIREGSEVGWEGAVFDHFQALVVAITNKLNSGHDTELQECQGGQTLSFELTDEHPLSQEVLGTLARVRKELDDLWERVGKHNAAQKDAAPGESDAAVHRVVTFYFGQSVVDRDEGLET